MPNHKPLVRAMDWKMAKREMPDSVSRHLPDGDPSENHQEIKREIDRMLALGPDGRSTMKEYVNGDINEEQLEKKLENISENIENQQLESFRRNLRIIKEETYHPVWKEMIPVIYKVDMSRIRKASERLSNIQKMSEEERQEKNLITD